LHSGNHQYGGHPSDQPAHAGAEPLRAANALIDIAGPVPAAIAALRQAARAAVLTDRLEAATTLRELTGDDGPLLAAIRDGLSQTGGSPGAAADAAEDSPPPAWVIPALRRALAATASAAPPDVSTRALLAHALWYLGDGADTDAVLPVIAAGLRPPPGSPAWPDGPRARLDVIDTASSLGSDARPLIPDLTALLDDPLPCPRAAAALRKIDAFWDDGPGGAPLTQVAGHLVTAAGAPDGREQFLAVTPGHARPAALYAANEDVISTGNGSAYTGAG
jgi:hypothetical protein